MRSATIANAVEISGPGLFTGQPCRAVISPSEPETGLVFIKGGVEIPALAKHYTEQPNCSVLAAGGERVMVTEHILSALWVAGIDTARIEVEGPELPNRDGSAQLFHRALYGAGRVEHGQRVLHPATEPVAVSSEGDAFLEYIPGASEGLLVEYSFTHRELGAMELKAVLSREWAGENLMRARTFITATEAQAAQAAGVLQHDNIDAALLITEGVASQPLHWPDEYVRHKVLDLLGDLAVLPWELNGMLRALRSGHALNRALARKLALE